MFSVSMITHVYSQPGGVLQGFGPLVLPFTCLMSFPSTALRIPTAHNFTHDQRTRIKKMAAFSLRLELAIEVNCHFLENKYGDLSFFSVVLN